MINNYKYWGGIWVFFLQKLKCFRQTVIKKIEHCYSELQ